jgi:hypothetical protein
MIYRSVSAQSFLGVKTGIIHNHNVCRFGFGQQKIAKPLLKDTCGYRTRIAAFTQNPFVALTGYNINSCEHSPRNTAENLFTAPPPRPVAVIETRQAALVYVNASKDRNIGYFPLIFPSFFFITFCITFRFFYSCSPSLPKPCLPLDDYI